MGCYIDQNGSYYEGDRAHWRDKEVPSRPSPDHEWIGDDWVLQPARLLPRYELALDDYLDAVAQAYRFSTRHTLSLRAGYPNSFRDLATPYAVWMDGCNDLAKALLADVLAGRKPLPSVAEFLAALPAFVPPPSYVAEA